MELNEYQKEAATFAEYPEGYIIQKNDVFVKTSWDYPTLGLAGETGEVCDKLKKAIRDKNGVVDSFDRDEIKKELGDVLWYISAIANELGLTLEDVAKTNIAKLTSRRDRNVLHGFGDNR